MDFLTKDSSSFAIVNDIEDPDFLKCIEEETEILSAEAPHSPPTVLHLKAEDGLNSIPHAILQALDMHQNLNPHVVVISQQDIINEDEVQRIQETLQKSGATLHLLWMDKKNKPEQLARISKMSGGLIIETRKEEFSAIFKKLKTLNHPRQSLLMAREFDFSFPQELNIKVPVTSDESSLLITLTQPENKFITIDARNMEYGNCTTTWNGETKHMMQISIPTTQNQASLYQIRITGLTGIGQIQIHTLARDNVYFSIYPWQPSKRNESNHIPVSHSNKEKWHLRWSGVLADSLHIDAINQAGDMIAATPFTNLINESPILTTQQVQLAIPSSETAGLRIRGENIKGDRFIRYLPLTSN